MCGRYTLDNSYNFKKRFGLSDKEIDFNANYNIAPASFNPVVIKNSPKRIVMMKWGLVPFWAKDPRIGYKMINARSEGIENKPAFRKPIRTTRCLIPSDGFYEWKRLSLEKMPEKIPFYITLKDQEIFSFAGIYDEWSDAEGKKIYSYSIITTNANDLMSDIHDRMPVILEYNDEDKYLDKITPLEEILDLLKPYDSGKMRSYPVSKAVNNPENNDETIIKEIEI